MMFTKFFTVAALATTLTAGAFAMEHGGTDSRHEEYKDQVSHDLDFANQHREGLQSSSSASESISKILSTVAKANAAVNNILTKTTACTQTDLPGLKTCVKALASTITGSSTVKSLTETALHVSCTNNFISKTCATTEVREACGIIACNTGMGGKVSNCLKAATDKDQKSCGSFYTD